MNELHYPYIKVSSTGKLYLVTNLIDKQNTNTTFVQPLDSSSAMRLYHVLNERVNDKNYNSEFINEGET